MCSVWIFSLTVVYSYKMMHKLVPISRSLEGWHYRHNDFKKHENTAAFRVGYVSLFCSVACARKN